jgi:hypothetical protein
MSIISMTCSHPGCNDLRHKAGIQNGKPFYRKKCLKHYNLELAKKKGFSSVSEYRQVVDLQIAKKNGFNSVQDYKNSKHPYRFARKDYCENLDGRLGYVCTTTIVINAQLEVDHIDGNPSNNKIENLQTLCGCCHTYKTAINKDYLTEGRKVLGITY